MGFRSIHSLSFCVVSACALAASCAAEPEQGGSASRTAASRQPLASPYNESFTAFESGHVRPLAITPGKEYLLATNTPDAKLEIFKIKQHGLEHVASVPVGLEPVAVAVRNDHEAWVVNHLSDSVSVVALAGSKSHVTRTL